MYQGDTYQGSAVMVEIEQHYYIISAAHVFYNDFNKVLSIMKFHGISEEYGELKFKMPLGTSDQHEEHDIIVIPVDTLVEFSGFPKIQFCEDISFPGLSFVFRGTAKSPAKKPHSVGPCQVDTSINENGIFCLEIPLGSYADTTGNVGAQVLDGYSGSGIFIKEVNDIFLVGIVQKVEKDSFTGVNCRSINIVKKAFIRSLDISDFHGGNTQLKLNVAEIRRKVTRTMIEERKVNKYGDVENITRKMDAFLDDWTNEDLDKFISDIITWEYIEHTKIRNNSRYRNLIENAKAILASGNKKYKVQTVQQGNERFHQIVDEFTELLKSELEGTPIRTSSPVFAAGEIARLLANCTLDFKK